MISKTVNILPEGRVLVAPLNWGLGHATRCIPVINELIRQGHEVIIAADGYPLNLLRSEFPDLLYVEFQGLDVRYSKRNSQVFSMLWQSPKFLFEIFKEHRHLSKLVRQYDIDIVISDNRFGLWCKDVFSVYITHQLMVKMPDHFRFLESFVWRFHRWFIRHYDLCWVPDFPGLNNLSGDLSHKYPLLSNTSFIGPLSRFNDMKIKWEDIKSEAEYFHLNEHYSVLILISGPEPHRSYMQQWAESKYMSKDTLIVLGLPDTKQVIDNSPYIISHLPTLLLQYYIQQTDKIICRSGYSSIMDLFVLGKTAELIPTPGQTEQEYLKTLHDK